MRKILLVLLLALNLYGFTATDSLVAWYKLTEDCVGDSGAGMFPDFSGNGNHATFYGDTNFTDNHLGNSNSAMIFDGSTNYLNCGNDNSLNLVDGDFSYQAWVNLDVDNAGMSLFHKRAALSDRIEFHFDANSGRTTAYFPGTSVLIPHSYLQSGYYHLYTFVYDFSNKEIKIYRNGRLAGRGSVSATTSATNSADLIIGYFQSWGNNYFDGAIDEIKIYNRKLEQSEILNEFNSLNSHIIIDDFERSTISKDIIWDDDVLDWGNNSSSIITSGDGSYKVSPNGGSYGSFTCLSPDENEDGTMLSRTELVQKNNTGDSAFVYYKDGDDIWIKYYLMLDAAWDDNIDNWNNLGQVKESSVVGGLAPMVQFTYRNSKAYIIFRGWSDTTTSAEYQNSYPMVSYQDFSVTKDEWNEVVIHIKVSKYDSVGYSEAWFNDDHMLPENQSFTVHDIENYKLKMRTIWGLRTDGITPSRGMYFKYGYYRGLETGVSSGISNTVYYDGVKIGNTAESIGFMPAKYSDVTPTDDLVAHYKLREEDYVVSTGMFYDVSGNENHATANGTVNFTSNHLDSSNSAMVFDGSTNYLQIPHNTDLNIGTDDYSVLAWVKPTTIMNSNYLFSKGSGTDWFGYKFKNMRYSTIFTYQDGDYEGHEYIGSALIKDSYVLVGMSIHDDSVYVYKNGNLSAKDKYSGNLIANPTNTGDMYIGKMLTYASYFIGNIEEIKFYKRALTKTEMLDEFDDCMPHGIYDDLESSTMEVFWNLQQLGNGSWELDGSDPYSGDSCLKITHTGDADVLAHRIDYEEASSEYGSGVHYGETRWISCYWKADAGFTWEESVYSEERGRYVGDVWNGVGIASKTHDGDNRGMLGTNYWNDTLCVGGSFYKNRTDVPTSDSRDTWDSYFDGYGVPVEKDHWYRIITKRELKYDGYLYSRSWVEDTETGFVYDMLPESGSITLEKWEEYPTLDFTNHTVRALTHEDAEYVYNKILYYRGSYPTNTNSVYFDDIMIGNTSKSIGFGKTGTIGDTIYVEIKSGIINSRFYSFTVDYDNDKINIIDYDFTDCIGDNAARLHFPRYKTESFKFSSYGLNLINESNSDLIRLKIILLDTGNVFIDIKRNMGGSTTNGIERIQIDGDETGCVFDSVDVRYAWIYNRGDMDLILSSIISDSECFSVYNQEYVINGGDSVDIAITSVCDYKSTGRVTITSNDPKNETAVILCTKIG